MKAFAFALLCSTLVLAAQQQKNRGPDTAPKLGDAIPVVSAASPDGQTTVAFSKPERLTVLIFGSHT